MIKVKDKIKLMKRSKGSRGSKEIRRKIDLTQKDAKAKGQKKTRQQTRRFLMLDTRVSTQSYYAEKRSSLGYVTLRCTKKGTPDKGE